MCMKNINALGVIILFLSAFIQQYQSGKHKLKQAKSVYYETDNTSTDSEEDNGQNIEDLAAKILLSSEHSAEALNDEKITKDGHKNEDAPHKDFTNKHYLILRSSKESSIEYEINRGNFDKNVNEDGAPNFENLVTQNILIPKDDTESSQKEKIITGYLKSNSNHDVQTQGVSAEITHKNLANAKESSREDEVIRDNPKVKINERVPSSHNDLAERTDLNLEDTKESIREDEVVRGDIQSKFNERLPSKHEDLVTKTRLNLEDTQESIKEDEIARGDTIVKFNTPSKHKDLAGRPDLNLEDTKKSIIHDEIIRGNPKTKVTERVPSKHKDLVEKTGLYIDDTKESIREGVIEKTDTNIKLNIPNQTPTQTFLVTGTNLYSDDAIELRGKDEIVKGNGEKSENPSVDEKVLTAHLTNEKSNQNRGHKRISKQWTPPPIIIRAQQKKVSSSKNPVSSESSSDDDKAIQKDIKKVKGLRQAYGDACVRVVLRKCMKALKSTLKQLCKSGGKTCKREFKDDFKESAITGCLMQYNNKSTFRIGNKGSMETGAQFEDSTRTLSMTCLRALSDTATEETQTAVKSEIVDAETKHVNILRDKYEKACQKQSYLKCRTAGEYVSNTTCSKHDCSSAKKKAIKRIYKKFCQNYYGYVKSSSSISEISSSSKSDSSSDSDSKSASSD